jgi:predicted RNase H-like HicB family nuclease
MKAGSKKPVKSKNEALSRPFDPHILARAREIANKYRIVLEPGENSGYVGTSLEMPGVMGDGTTPNACVKHVRDGLVVGVAYLLEKGQEPPTPENEQVRNKQINIRVSEAEQRRLKEAAKAMGFSDISDFMRTTILSK